MATTRLAPDAAVDRTVMRARPTTRCPSGDSSVIRIGNAPDVRATTGKRWVVFSRLSSRSMTVPAGKSSLSLSILTTTWTGLPVLFLNVTGISPVRAVSVNDRPSGISMASSWAWTWRSAPAT